MEVYFKSIIVIEKNKVVMVDRLQVIIIVIQLRYYLYSLYYVE